MAPKPASLLRACGPGDGGLGTGDGGLENLERGGDGEGGGRVRGGGEKEECECLLAFFVILRAVAGVVYFPIRLSLCFRFGLRR